VGISPHLPLCCSWDKDELIRVWGQKIKGEGSSETTHGQISSLWDISLVSGIYGRIVMKLVTHYQVHVTWMTSSRSRVQRSYKLMIERPSGCRMRLTEDCNDVLYDGQVEQFARVVIVNDSESFVELSVCVSCTALRLMPSLSSTRDVVLMCNWLISSLLLMLLLVNWVNWRLVLFCRVAVQCGKRDQHFTQIV